MADKKLTDLAQINPSLGDVFYVVDLDDTTDDPAGSSRKGLLPVPLFDHYADVSTSSTNGTEDDLYTDTTAANTLNANGEKIEAYYALIGVSSATAARRIKAYFAGTLIADTGSLTLTSAGTISIYVTIIRESSTVVRVQTEIVVSGITFSPLETYTRITGLTLSGTNILKITGIASGTGAAAADIVAKLGTVKKWPAA